MSEEVGTIEFTSVMESIVRVFEAVGVGIIVLGSLYALVRVIAEWRSGEAAFGRARKRFGRPLILGLEVLVAADIIETITVALTLERVVTLGILVLTRVVLSMALEIEIDGVAPWRKAELRLRCGQQAVPVESGAPDMTGDGVD